MNPVIGLDVAKGESQVQAFLDKRKPYRKSFSVLHNVEELNNLLGFLKEIETLADGKTFGYSGINGTLPYSCYSIFGGTSICIYYSQSTYLSSS